jgi:hypothetical protein
MSVSPVDFFPPISDTAAKAKGPADKAVYLPDLPLDIRKLITPFLVNEGLDGLVRESDLMKRRETTPEASELDMFRDLANLCRDDVAQIKLYREIALDPGEHLADPENLREISRFLKTYDTAAAHHKTRSCIEKAQFTVAVTSSAFKYSNDAAAKASPLLSTGAITIMYDGYRALHRPLTNTLVYTTPVSRKLHPSQPKYLDIFSVIRDFALAPTGILFVATERDLQIYDLNQPTIHRWSGPKVADATLLHKLHYRFDKITWDEKRACLIGEKEGLVTEIGVNPLASSIPHFVTPPPPKPKLSLSLKAKIAYTAKKVLKIIVVEGPLNALKGTKKGLALFDLSKRKLIAIIGLGALGTALFATGFLVCAVAPPIFAIFGLPAAIIGSGLISVAIQPLIFPPFFGIISGISETFSSLNQLRKD